MCTCVCARAPLRVHLCPLAPDWSVLALLVPERVPDGPVTIALSRVRMFLLVGSETNSGKTENLRERVAEKVTTRWGVGTTVFLFAVRLPARLCASHHSPPLQTTLLRGADGVAVNSPVRACLSLKPPN